jgi:hypothetical protein
MQVQKQFVSVPLNLGVDTKTDPKSVGFGAMLTLENGSFHHAGAISKRHGHTLLDTKIEPVTTGSLRPDIERVTNATGLAVFNDELLLFDGRRLFTYIESTKRWGYRGRTTPVRVTDQQAVRNSYDQADPDAVTAHGVRYVAWDDERGNARLSVFDEATGAAIVHDIEINPGGAAVQPKLVVAGDVVLLFYIDGTDLFVERYFPKTSPTTPPGTLTVTFSVTSGVTATSPYDVVHIGAYTYIAATVVGGVAVYQLDEDFGVTTLTGFAGTGDDCVSVFGNTETGIWAASSGLLGMSLTRWTYGSTSAAVFAVQVDLPLRAARITGTVNDTSAFLYYEIEASDPWDNYIRTVEYSLAGVAAAAAGTLARSVGLAGKAFLYNDVKYFLASHSSTLQATYFLINHHGNVIARINPTEGGVRTSALLPEVTELSDGVYSLAMQVKGRLLSSFGDVYAQLGVNTAVIDISNPRQMAAELDGNLILTGGALNAYDGRGVTEHGFHLFPENVAGVVNPTPALGLLEAGKTYFWRACYEWTDAQGFIHRSSPDADGNTLVAAALDSVTITVPTLRLTRKEGVRIVVYRTAGDGSVYYRLPGYTENTTSANTVDFFDDFADAEITSNEVLYTTGGVLEHIAPGPASIAVPYRGRVFLAGMSDGNRILHSTRTVPGEAVAFNDALSIDVDPYGGPVTGLGVLDDKLIIFKESAIYVMAGDGPTDTGTQSDYGDPTRIASDVGCASAASVVATPNGIMFKSAKGIYLLDRSLTVTYLGAAVESLNDSDVTGAAVIPRYNNVRFVSSASGSAPVYHYDVGQWSVYTNHAAVGCVNWGGRFVFARSNGRVCVEDPDVFTDAGVGYSLKLVSAWLQTAQIQGFQRAWRCYVLGAYKGAHRLRMKFGYDHHDEFEQDLTIDTEEVMDLGTYGDDATYGATSPYGGEFPLYHFRVHLARQKCTAIRVSIEDLQSSNYNEAYSLSGIAFLVGTKMGGPKLPGKLSVGSERVT